MRPLPLSPGVRPPQVLVRLVALALPIALTLGGCGQTEATLVSPAAASASISPSAESATPSPIASDSSPSSVSPPSSSRPTVALDASLLDVLPSEVDGVALVPTMVIAAQMATDPSLAVSIEAIAVAFAIREEASTGGDLAIASVLRLRPAAFGDPWFRAYRASYDTAACEPAGGVDGEPSETTIGGRTAYVGTCAEGAQTYHVHLAGSNIVVSVLATGPHRFGELVVAGLAE